MFVHYCILVVTIYNCRTAISISPPSPIKWIPVFHQRITHSPSQHHFPPQQLPYTYHTSSSNTFQPPLLYTNLFPLSPFYTVLHYPANIASNHDFTPLIRPNVGSLVVRKEESIPDMIPAIDKVDTIIQETAVADDSSNIIYPTHINKSSSKKGLYLDFGRFGDGDVERNTNRPSKCGMRQNQAKSDLEEQISVSAAISEDSTDSKPDQIPSSTQNNLVWAVPENEQTVFYKSAGHLPWSSWKITYGRPTKRKEVPWQAALLLRNYKYLCGASIVHPLYILTAGHCVSSYRFHPSILSVVLGDWDISSTKDGATQKIMVDKVIVHEHYSMIELANDIALLKLKKTITFNDYIQPVCLLSSDVPLDRRLLTVVGWGRNENNKLQSQLKKLTAATVPNRLCSQMWEAENTWNPIRQSHFCMNPQDGDSCKGDSGGPSLMEYPEGSGIWVQVGVVSFGSASCKNKRLPGVYTKVAHFAPWIKQNILG